MSTMAESGEKEKKIPESSNLSFLEVKCRSSGKVRRFAQGTESRFALRVINSKLESGVPLALCIAAVKEGEEPVIFGPSATLANYGDGWKLETLINNGEDDMPMKEPTSTKKELKKKNNDITVSWLVTYIGKILLVFAFMFFIAGVYSYFLVVLPDLLSSLKSYWEGSTTPMSS
ncbi:DNA-directed RNA polymerase subunit beta [Rhynchospora pubera]|uniref:DNA-directed RNA polymerase subunit beta n=1 Tax=Rhynchospora pubera TaxID=906938 RepID=A0AAV8HAD4_9POAL|nr:DNA-directed RNA polymerase subunit beta [Rhynchospora pubera]